MTDQSVLSIAALPRRIGIFTTSYPASDDDSAGHFVHAQAKHLVARGASVSVIAGASANTAGLMAVPATTRIADSGLFSRGGAPDAIEDNNSFVTPAVVAARYLIEGMRRRSSFDGVIANWLMPCAAAASLCKGPLLAIAHGGDIHLLARTKLLAPTLAALCLRQAKFSFVSKQLLSFALMHVPARLADAVAESSVVIPMGIDLARVRAVSAVRTESATKRILLIGRHVAIKGFDLVIAACAKLQIPTTVTLLGSGPSRSAIQAQAKAIEAQNPLLRFVFLGQVSPQRRDRELANTDLVIVPSKTLRNGRTEGMPLVAIEALAAGVPLIVSHSGGLADLAEPVVVMDNMTDREAFASHIEQSLIRPPSATVLRAIAQQYDWNVLMPKLLSHWLSA